MTSQLATKYLILPIRSGPQFWEINEVFQQEEIIQHVELKDAMDLGGQNKDVVRVPWDKKHLKHGVQGLQEADDQKDKAFPLIRWSEGFLDWEAQG